MPIGRLLQTFRRSHHDVLADVSPPLLQSTWLTPALQTPPKPPALLQREQELYYVSKAMGLTSSLHEQLEDFDDPILDPFVLDLSDEDSSAPETAMVILTQTNLRDDGEFSFYVPACEDGENLLFGCVDIPAQATYILLESGRPHPWWLRVSRDQARRYADVTKLMPT
ncbi:hypothetical protein [Deinococcus soli (ex Cha et al. 2016)]|uniref:Uncharacterized protein n=2 Tax=Deinococcus soli (ex Cha et al. 2016) TaxID=1309411 RepID=A0ACC6KJX2_9DEIO|nr:hypothetical protein [Deinococcus soli (ex Cha et al. 2016)]MDR6219847.1 hypothetical protein [Deinococcus soli (ex Cha et al. 2016)]MDR6329895.1 hypothetical protein [Deinococcus soli (ex Cha et al. 2016)]MDR6752754.1 hypothetical protein [Deinococcus soli (ex Cha et al. 2016)]